VRIQFFTNTTVKTEYTYNVFCTLNAGKSTDVVMLGSHLGRFSNLFVAVVVFVVAVE